MNQAIFISRSYLRCPECGSHFSDDAYRRWKVSRDEKMLRCETYGHRFAVKHAVADLLPPHYAAVLERLDFAARQTKPTDLELATDWLGDALGLQPPTLVPGRNRTLRQLLNRVAALLHIAREMKLDQTDIRELYAILAGEAMAAGYRQHVADPARASLEAVNFEKYEDILLRNVVSNVLAQCAQAALIELGSGPGRLLHQYGSTIATRRGAGEPYRRLSPELYSPDSLKQHERLQLLLGVDFAEDMLLSASRWLTEDLLGDLLETGRIAQVRATVRNVPLDFADPEWRGTARIACILFQTLGNQLGKTLQVAMLESARRCVGDNGVVFVSVFNAEAFQEQGLPYYESIEGSVGGVWGLDERAFLSDRGVYSRWLYPHELTNLMEAAGMVGATVIHGDDLATFPEFASYIDEQSQLRYKRRALIGIYSKGISIAL